MKSDIQEIAKMVCGDQSAWEKQDVFIEYLRYAISSLMSSDVTKPGFLLKVQHCV